MDSQSVESKLQGCLFNTQQSTNEDKQQWMVQEPTLRFKYLKTKKKKKYLNIKLYTKLLK